MKRFNAMLAEDGVLDDNGMPVSILYPSYASVKLDGVRGLMTGDGLVGRSLRPFNNAPFCRAVESMRGASLDFEITVGAIDDGATCRRTASFLNSSAKTYSLKDNVCFWVFDSFANTDDALENRLVTASRVVHGLQQEAANAHVHLRMIKQYAVSNSSDATAHIDAHAADNAEGTILRYALGKYKFGRATAKEATYLRFKRFVEEDAVVISVVEGNQNNNEATTDLRGRTKRSTHKEHMVPNGRVGSLVCKDVKTGDVITVSAGKMTAVERKEFFTDQSLIVGKRIKYKHMPYGAKNSPRMPVYLYIIPQ